MAIRLGYANVDAMLREITAKQFTEWEAYARLDPFSEVRADYRAASIAMTVYNMAVEGKHRKKLEDFMLKWDSGDQPASKKQTWQQQQSIARMIVAAYSAPGRDA
jgi:hypothetical protein